MKNLHNCRGEDEAANVGLEFVLAVPLILAMILFGLESGMLYLDQQRLDDAMRSATRFAALGVASQGLSDRSFAAEQKSAETILSWLERQVLAGEGTAFCSESCMSNGEGAFRMLLVSAYSLPFSAASGAGPISAPCRVRLISQWTTGDVNLFSRPTAQLVDDIGVALSHSGECQASFQSKLPDSDNLKPVERWFAYFEAAKRGRRILIGDELVLRADAISGGLDG
ncbi:MAG: TadE/TadG family type IV pilus assembly protein [bacterium]|nr:TadE/TadG family type IV pilus assembly protein [bacterium]